MQTLSAIVVKLCSKICFFLACLVLNSAISAQTVTIGLLYDGPIGSSIISSSLIESEIKNILEPDYQVNFINRAGFWNGDKIEQELISLLNNDNIEMVVTMGLVSSHIAGKLPNLRKPVIGSFVPDPTLQRIPLTRERTSGKTNYTYISFLQNVQQSTQEILSVLPTENVALFVDELIIDGIPELVANQSPIGDTPLTIVKLSNSIQAAAAQIPANTDTLLVAPLLRSNIAEIKSFAEILKARKIHSVSFIGKQEVEAGLLISIGSQAEDDLRSARRIALNIFSILNGESAADLNIQIKRGERISYNVDTAAALGFELPWDLQLTSEEIYTQDPSGGLNLDKIIELALENTLSYQIEKLDLDISQADVDAAKSILWPQLSLNASYTQLNEDSAQIGSPEQQSNISLSLNQLLYSEAAETGSKTAELVQASQQQLLNIAMLDTIANASAAYIGILQTQAVEAVQRSNLQLSLQNLQLAENRLALGAVSSNDVTRWESQIATDKQNLLQAKADVRNAIISLQTLLNQAFEPQNFDKTSQENLITRLTSNTIESIFDNPRQNSLLRQWTLQNGMTDSPEIKLAELNYQIFRQQLNSKKRERYIPDIQSSLSLNQNLSRSGAFAAETDAIAEDDNWSLTISASLPLLSGGGQKAETNKAELALQQSIIERQQATNNVRLNITNTLNQISASYPSIRLSREASEAADKSLASTQDQYSNGTISITSLIDAQNTALAAQLTAAQSEYAFLNDLIDLMRATSDFTGLRDDTYTDYWLDEFEEYKQEANN